MSKIERPIYWVTLTTTETNKHFCKQNGIMCELATDCGYCQVTACTKQNEVNDVLQHDSRETY